MIIARIIGTVVATQKDPRLEGRKLLIVRPLNVDGSDTTGYVVAVDTGRAFRTRAGGGRFERVWPRNERTRRLMQPWWA
jgi:microcompartment protein CcmK/EutM